MAGLTFVPGMYLSRIFLAAVASYRQPAVLQPTQTGMQFSLMHQAVIFELEQCLGSFCLLAKASACPAILNPVCWPSESRLGASFCSPHSYFPHPQQEKKMVLFSWGCQIFASYKGPEYPPFISQPGEQFQSFPHNLVFHACVTFYVGSRLMHISRSIFYAYIYQQFLHFHVSKAT